MINIQILTIMSIVRYLNPLYRNPARITKADKKIAKKLDLRNIKFPVKIRDIRKIAKKNSIGINDFGYENKEKHESYVSNKCCKEKHAGLILMSKEGKRHFFLSKDFNTFMYDNTLHRGS